MIHELGLSIFVQSVIPGREYYIHVHISKIMAILYEGKSLHDIQMSDKQKRQMQKVVASAIARSMAL